MGNNRLRLDMSIADTLKGGTGEIHTKVVPKIEKYLGACDITYGRDEGKGNLNMYLTPKNIISREKMPEILQEVRKQYPEWRGYLGLKEKYN